MFSTFHGENITRGPDEISWASNTFDGFAVTSKRIKVGDVFIAEIDGGKSGGHVLIGITACNDDEIFSRIRTGKQIESISTDVGVYKNKTQCKIEMKSKTELIQTFNRDEKKHIINANANYRVCSTLLFGHLQVKIQDKKKFQWDSNSNLHGTNINISNDKTVISLLNENPHAICALDKPLEEGENIGFDVSDIKANWYYIKLFVSSQPPSQSTVRDPISADAVKLMPLAKIKNPQEQLVIQLIDSSISITVGINSYHSLNIMADKNTPIYLYFELFRVKLKVKPQPEIDEYLKEYVTLSEPAPFYDEIYGKSPSLYVKKQGEAKESEKVSEILKNLDKNLKRSNSLKKSVIYNYLKEFDHGLSSIENNYEKPVTTSSEQKRPKLPLPQLRDVKSAGSSAQKSASARSLTDDRNEFSKPKIFIPDGSESLHTLIHDLKKRVETLEKTKKVTLATSVNVDFTV